MYSCPYPYAHTYIYNPWLLLATLWNCFRCLCPHIYLSSLCFRCLGSGRSALINLCLLACIAEGTYGGLSSWIPKGPWCMGHTYSSGGYVWIIIIIPPPPPPSTVALACVSKGYGWKKYSNYSDLCLPRSDGNVNTSAQSPPSTTSGLQPVSRCGLSVSTLLIKNISDYFKLYAGWLNVEIPSNIIKKTKGPTTHLIEI